MILIYVLLTTFAPLRASKDILVRREENYDTIVWDGECNRINANTVIFGDEKTCICKKRFDVNGIKTELNGFFYQNTDGVPACLYDYRETGANFFIHPRYSTSIYVIDDTPHNAKFITQGAHRLYPLRYSPSIRIAIKEIRRYMFNNDTPLLKFPNDIFQLISQNVTEGDTSRERYLIQVNVSAIKNVKGNLVQIIFEEQYKKGNMKRDIGFTVVKFVGKVTYNLDLSEIPQKGTYNIATIALTITAGIMGIIIVILVVKLRYNNSKENKEKIATSGMRSTPDKRIARPRKHITKNYKHFHDDDNTAMSYITANESSNPNNIRKVEPIYETSDSLGFNKYSEKNEPIIKYGYYNGSYWYDEVQE